MSHRSEAADSWRQMVLRSMPDPQWLNPCSNKTEVVLSSRHRVARNLFGHRFPTSADEGELRRIDETVHRAVSRLPVPLHRIDRMSPVERDYWVGARLISPDFDHEKKHRTVYVSEDRSIVLMVNEEDHLRLQCLTAGWSIPEAVHGVQNTLTALSATLQFAYWEPIGFLTTSPHNAGMGLRTSALMHLVALGFQKRLPRILDGLGANSITYRGLFGESSRAIGAYFQISTTTPDPVNFLASCGYLIEQEESARNEVGADAVLSHADEIRRYLIESRTVTLADSVRALSWLRWAVLTSPDSFGYSARDIDRWLVSLDVHGTSQNVVADRRRADYLRSKLEQRSPVGDRC